MTLTPRRRVVRVRQRSQTPLKSFARRLLPTLSEVGVDRVQITVGGTWRAVQIAGFSGQDYHAALTDVDPRVNWFRVPDASPNKISIRTRNSPDSTVGHVAAEVSGFIRSSGRIRIAFHCNPTRTLAHLLARFPCDGMFPTLISSLDHVEFFSRADPPPPEGMDGGDNWLADHAAVRDALGNDPFSAFLPIFVQQVQSLALEIVRPGNDDAVLIDGTSHVIRSEGFEGRLDWATASVPQIETYFERYHAKAVGAVATIAGAALTTSNDMTAWLHEARPAIERSMDCISLSVTMAHERRLAIYAKSTDRLRFEIRRSGRGRYPAPLYRNPADRLLAIFEIERAFLVETFPWEQIGELFDEPDLPSATDLVDLASVIAEACGAVGCAPRPMMSALLLDGGLSDPNEIGVPRRAIDRLVRAGVLERRSLRQRDVRGSRRFGLTLHYRAIRDATLLMFLSNDDDAV